MSRWALLVPVLAGGAAGALVRVALTESVPPAGGQWPWATFIVNLAGALILGYTLEAFRDQRSARVRILLGSGFCGALTTFSTFEVELLDLLGSGHVAVATAYAVSSIATGLLAAVLGGRLARIGTLDRRAPWNAAPAAAENGEQS